MALAKLVNRGDFGTTTTVWTAAGSGDVAAGVLMADPADIVIRTDTGNVYIILTGGTLQLIGTTAGGGTGRPSSTVTPGATPTWALSNAVNGVFRITALAAAITNMSTNGSLSGAAEGNSMIFEITDNGTARALAWGTLFEPSGTIALPTTTVISTKLTVGFLYNPATSKMTCVAVA